MDVQLNNEETHTFKLNTRGRSEAWKENVLRNAASFSFKTKITEKGEQTLKLSVNQTGIVIDQIAIHAANYPKYYEIQAN